jgi:hypothetical protein
MLQLILLSSLIALWTIGGSKRKIRVIGVPILIGLGVYIWPTWQSLVASILTIGAANVIRIGYGNWSDDDPKKSTIAVFLSAVFGYKDRSGEIIRLIWGLLVGILLPLFLYTFHFIALPVYGAYVLINCVVNYLVSKLKLPVFITDVLVGGAVGVIIFLAK